MSKKIVKKNKSGLELKKLSFSDLHAVYVFVNNLNGATFGKKIKAKTMLRDKLAEIENELYNRVFGLNPFSLEKSEVLPQDLINKLSDIKGQDPVKVINSFKVAVLDKNFAVVSPEGKP